MKCTKRLPTEIYTQGALPGYQQAIYHTVLRAYQLAESSRRASSKQAVFHMIVTIYLLERTSFVPDFYFPSLPHVVAESVEHRSPVQKIRSFIPS